MRIECKASELQQRITEIELQQRITEMTTGRTVLKIRDMTIDIRSSVCVFIEVGDKTFYVDDSTGESIMDWWYTSDIPRYMGRALARLEGEKHCEGEEDMKRNDATGGQ